MDANMRIDTQQNMPDHSEKNPEHVKVRRGDLGVCPVGMEDVGGMSRR